MLQGVAGFCSVFPVKTLTILSAFECYIYYGSIRIAYTHIHINMHCTYMHVTIYYTFVMRITSQYAVYVYGTNIDLCT